MWKVCYNLCATVIVLNLLSSRAGSVGWITEIDADNGCNVPSFTRLVVHYGSKDHSQTQLRVCRTTSNTNYTTLQDKCKVLISLWHSRSVTNITLTHWSTEGIVTLNCLLHHVQGKSTRCNHLIQHKNRDKQTNLHVTFFESVAEKYTVNSVQWFWVQLQYNCTMRTLHTLHNIFCRGVV